MAFIVGIGTVTGSMLGGSIWGFPGTLLGARLGGPIALTGVGVILGATVGGICGGTPGQWMGAKLGAAIGIIAGGIGVPPIAGVHSRVESLFNDRNIKVVGVFSQRTINIVNFVEGITKTWARILLSAWGAQVLFNGANLHHPQSFTDGLNCCTAHLTSLFYSLTFAIGTFVMWKAFDKTAIWRVHQ